MRNAAFELAGTERGRAGIAGPPVLFRLDPRSTTGVVGDRLERVHLAVAVPRVVPRAALAGLDGAAVRSGDDEVVDAGNERRVRQRRRTRLRVCRLIEVGLDLLGPHLPVLRAVRL